MSSLRVCATGFSVRDGVVLIRSGFRRLISRGSTVRLGLLSLDWELDDSSTGKVRVRRRWVLGLDVEARGSLGGDALRVLRVAGMMCRGHEIGLDEKEGERIQGEIQMVLTTDRIP